MGDLGAVEARVWAVLDPYRHELVDSSIYGIPALRWPGAGAHDYFAAVKRSSSKVSLHAIAVDRWPEALGGASEWLHQRRTGRATFSSRSWTTARRPSWRRSWGGCTS